MSIQVSIVSALEARSECVWTNRRARQVYGILSQRLPSHQLFHLRFPEPKVVSMYLDTLSGILYHEQV